MDKHRAEEKLKQAQEAFAQVERERNLADSKGKAADERAADERLAERRREATESCYPNQLGGIGAGGGATSPGYHPGIARHTGMYAPDVARYIGQDQNQWIGGQTALPAHAPEGLVSRLMQLRGRLAEAEGRLGFMELNFFGPEPKQEEEPVRPCNSVSMALAQLERSMERVESKLARLTEAV